MKMSLLFLLAVTSLMTFAAPTRGKLGANAIEFQTSNGYEMVEVEHIESSGVEYIDTKTVIKGDRISLEMDMLRDRSTAQYAVFMGCKQSGIGEFGINNNGAYYIQCKAYGQSVQLIDWNYWPSRCRIGIEVENGTLKMLVNGVVKNSKSVTAKDYQNTVWLFAGNGYPANDGKFIGKAYGAKISIDGELVRDFQPVRLTNVQGKSEGAMYDKISKEIFRNQGSGSFVIGPDL